MKKGKWLNVWKEVFSFENREIYCDCYLIWRLGFTRMSNWFNNSLLLFKFSFDVLYMLMCIIYMHLFRCCAFLWTLSTCMLFFTYGVEFCWFHEQQMLQFVLELKQLHDLWSRQWCLRKYWMIEDWLQAFARHVVSMPMLHVGSYGMSSRNLLFLSELNYSPLAIISLFSSWWSLGMNSELKTPRDTCGCTFHCSIIRQVFIMISFLTIKGCATVCILCNLLLALNL